MENSKQNSTIETPTPKDFEKYITWFCHKLNSSVEIFFKKIIKDENAYKRRMSRKSREKRISSASRQSGKSSTKTSVISIKTSPSRRNETQYTLDAVLITVIYNNHGSIIEVSITSPFIIPKEIFKALYICLPYHLTLNKLTINRRVNSMVICEINKLLTFTFITDLCLDGTYVPEGSYYILLSSHKLKSLSLRRCSINDLVCEKIADKINMCSSALLVLCLASNRITDVGVKAIGNALRINRCLLHLDVSNNSITDNGIIHLFNHLMEFKLNSDEIIAYKRKIARNFIEKYKTSHIYDQNYEFSDDKENVCNNNYGDHSYKCYIEFENVATIEIDTSNSFDKSDLMYKDGQFYAVGNLKLCSLNLAYNNFGYLALRVIYNVLEYQNNFQNSINGGLLRIVMNGNKRFSKILDEINNYLEEAVTNRAFVAEFKKKTYSQMFNM